MPNLEEFVYQCHSQTFDDQVLEAFIANTLPSLKKLKSFQLFIFRSKVTDSSVKRLFAALPEKWFQTMKTLVVELEKTRVSDESVKEFVEKSLEKFKNLCDFRIHTGNTDVSSGMKHKIVKWEEKISKKH